MTCEAEQHLATGGFTRNTQRQPRLAISTPPMTGPRARLIPLTAPYVPIARARSRGSVKTLVMTDSHEVQHRPADRLQRPEVVGLDLTCRWVSSP